jgi:hypothetical protein
MHGLAWGILTKVIHWVWAEGDVALRASDLSALMRFSLSLRHPLRETASAKHVRAWRDDSILDQGSADLHVRLILGSFVREQAYHSWGFFKHSTNLTVFMWRSHKDGINIDLYARTWNTGADCANRTDEFWYERLIGDEMRGRKPHVIQSMCSEFCGKNTRKSQSDYTNWLRYAEGSIGQLISCTAGLKIQKNWRPEFLRIWLAAGKFWVWVDYGYVKY